MFHVSSSLHTKKKHQPEAILRYAALSRTEAHKLAHGSGVVKDLIAPKIWKGNINLKHWGVESLSQTEAHKFAHVSGVGEGIITS